jgi:uroporphyrinogen decarboxylase
MNHKERVLRALSHQTVDRLPTQINYTAKMGEKLALHFGIPVSNLPEFFDNHLIRVDLSYPNQVSLDGNINFDWWGTGYDSREEGYFIRVNQLENLSDLDAYPWPDPCGAELMVMAEQMIEKYGSEYFIIPNLGFALFERAWALRGFERFLIDLASNPEFVIQLLDKITEIQLVLIGRYLDLGIDGGYFGDDYGAQMNLIMSPVTWRRYFKPRLKRLFAPFLERGLPVILHSDGQIKSILPDLLEIGLTALNPVQPEVLDHHWLQENFSAELAYYGGISTQTILPYGTSDEVHQAVADCREALAPQGSGLLLAPSHRMMTDIPMENVEALIEAFHSQ